MGLVDAETHWLNTTSEEEVKLSGFSEAINVRRPTAGPAAVAALKFGSYKDFANAWHRDNRVIWLAFIMSEQVGDGTILLGQIQAMAEQNGLAICGEPVPVKPRNWEATRPWLGDRHRLICWYLRNGFRVVQNKYASRFWYIPSKLEFEVKFELIHDTPSAGFFSRITNRL